MVNLQCSPDLRMFLCAIYAPVCTEYGRMTSPCRRLCLQAKSDCYQLMDMFGVSWPEEMDCNRLEQQQFLFSGFMCDDESVS
ncbi:Frizzled-3, partial [Xenoophorus captivus]